MTTERRKFLLGMAGLVATGTNALTASPALAQGTTRQFDFGLGGAAQKPSAGYIAVGPTDKFTPERGWGWSHTEGLQGRDRGGPGPLTRDLVFGTKGNKFHIAGLKPGRYRLTVIVGDLNYGDHATVLRMDMGGDVLIDGPTSINPMPVMHPPAATFATLTATLKIPDGESEIGITFNTPDTEINDVSDGNWAVNALRLEPVTAAEPLRIRMEKVPLPAPKSTWGPVLTWADPTAELIAGHRKRVAVADKSSFKSTGLGRKDYLTLITTEIDFWKTHQDKTTGAIIDPHLEVEFQYSTPAFAHAASGLVAYTGRMDLIEPAAKALDWAAHTLSERKAATGHEDFFAPMIAHAIRLLKPHVPAARSATWEADIRRFDPYKTYRAAIGGNNWNIVAATGEALFQNMGLRDKKSNFVEASFAAQGKTFGTPYGLYLEGPMAYDHFPRLWAADLIARGYTGPYYRELTEVLRRASITSLFMQSPWGEMPAGGRSAQHQWNEAEQCVTYEIYAAKALKDGDKDLAAYFKRAAHLALASMQRWVRPSGEMQIIKNWMDPSHDFAYERYSSHSQYNLLPMSMLTTAFEHAATTEKVAEQPAPADIGGYVLEIEALHKVFANAGGTYIEIDTEGDHHYDATGLIRVQMKHVSPQLGVSDSLVHSPNYTRPFGNPAPPTTGIGVAWKNSDDENPLGDPYAPWRYSGELAKPNIKTVTVTITEATTNRVAFSTRYEGNLDDVRVIEERFVVTPGRVEVTTRLLGFKGQVRRVVPLLADDGKTETSFAMASDHITVTQPGRDSGTLTFTMLGVQAITLDEVRHPNHNGYARLAFGDYPAGVGERGVTLVITSQEASR